MKTADLIYIIFYNYYIAWRSAPSPFDAWSRIRKLGSSVMHANMIENMFNIPSIYNIYIIYKIMFPSGETPVLAAAPLNGSNFGAEDNSFPGHKIIS